MNSFLMTFGLACIALCIGTLLRAKFPLLRNMLVSASVIAWLLGIVLMNGMIAACIVKVIMLQKIKA